MFIPGFFLPTSTSSSLYIYNIVFNELDCHRTLYTSCVRTIMNFRALCTPPPPKRNLRSRIEIEVIKFPFYNKY